MSMFEKIIAAGTLCVLAFNALIGYLTLRSVRVVRKQTDGVLHTVETLAKREGVAIGTADGIAIGRERSLEETAANKVVVREDARLDAEVGLPPRT